MKKLLYILILTISMFSFFIFFNEFKETQKFNIENIESKLENSYDVLIPSTILKLPRIDQYETLATTSNQSLSSIFFTRIDRTDGKEKIIKYIYTMDDKYMNSINLKSGKKLDKSLMNSNFFLSTAKTNDDNQIGVIEPVSDDFIFEIRTLNSMLNDGMSFTGFCKITFPNDKPVSYYISELSRLFSVDSIEYNKSEIINLKTNLNYIYILILFFIIILLILYDLLNSYKNIGVKKLLGSSNFDIYKENISKLLIYEIFCIILSIILMSFLLVDNFNRLYLIFLKNMIFFYLLILLLSFVSISLPYLYIKKIKIYHIIKNKTQTQEIILFNTFIKTTLIIGLICLLNFSLKHYNEFKKIYNGSYKAWEDASNYVVFNLDDLDFTTYESSEFAKSSLSLYKTLNEKGALYANFDMYSNLSIQNNKNIDYFKLSATVNPNYLNKHPIYDENNKQVLISEEDKNWIVLIPDKFKDDKVLIENYYNKWLNTFNKELIGELKIIWTKSDQKFFSYNINVNSYEGNYVYDPIVLVGTESGLFPGWNISIFNTSGNPFKIKIDSQDSLYSQLKPIISSTGINSSSLRISFADEEVISNVKQYKNILAFIIISFILIFFLSIAIISQNTYSFFNQYKKIISIKSFYGYNSIDKYKDYLLLLLISWTIIFNISLFLNISNFKIISLVTISGLAIEFLTSLLLLKRINKKKIVQIMKGDY